MNQNTNLIKNATESDKFEKKFVHMNYENNNLEKR